MCPYTICIGEKNEKNTHFITIPYKFIENDKIEEGTFSNSTNISLYPFDYHLEKNCVDFFRKLEYSQTHNCWPLVGE